MTTKAMRSPAAELQPEQGNTRGTQLDRLDIASAPPSGRPSKKSVQVITLLQVDDGATIAYLCAATNWQAHTCRAFLTGLRNKGRALERSHRADGASVYKLVAAEVAAQ